MTTSFNSKGRVHWTIRLQTRPDPPHTIQIPTPSGRACVARDPLWPPAPFTNPSHHPLSWVVSAAAVSAPPVHPAGRPCWGGAVVEEGDFWGWAGAVWCPTPGSGGHGARLSGPVVPAATVRAGSGPPQGVLRPDGLGRPASGRGRARRAGGGGCLDLPRGTGS